MRLFRTLFSFMIVAAIGISMITTCTTKTDFAKYYVSQSESKLGGFFDGALEVVTQQTKASNYLIFSVFEMDGERYVGIWGHFFGKASTEQAAKTLEGLLEKAGEGGRKEVGSFVIDI